MRNVMSVMFGVLLCTVAMAAPTVIPKPAEMVPGEGLFTLNAKTTVLVAESLKATGEDFAALLRKPTGFPVPVAVVNESLAATNAIVLRTDPAREDLGEEGYALEVTPNHVTVVSAGPAGAFYGCQTLRQLLPKQIEQGTRVNDVAWTLPCLRIKDVPRLGWRGCMLDSSRHFQGKAFVKRFIDLLAYHKLNRLHWHLADDQGWRVEIDAYPNLMKAGAFRPNAHAQKNYQPNPDGVPYGGFHSKADLREIVAFAQRRHVTIIPEIEMPGHNLAALMAYPELSCTGAPKELGGRWIYEDVFCAGNEKTFEFLTTALGEVIDLFPSPWIHIGGDECPKVRWQACAKCQERIRTESLKDEHELQSYFVKRIEAYINSRGRRLIGWDEILEGGLAPRATVQSWRGTKGGIEAATRGHDVVMSPTSHCYLDYTYEVTPVRKTYAFNPLPPELTADQQKHILGVECCMWLGNVSRRHLEKTGRILDASGIDHQVFPRLIALSEVGWSPKTARDWADFKGRLNAHGQRLDLLGVNYYRDPEVWEKQ